MGRDPEIGFSSGLFRGGTMVTGYFFLTDL